MYYIKSCLPRISFKLHAQAFQLRKDVNVKSMKGLKLIFEFIFLEMESFFHVDWI